MEKIKEEKLKEAATVGDYVSSLGEAADSVDGDDEPIGEVPPEGPEEVRERLLDMSADQQKEVKAALNTEHDAAEEATANSKDMQFDNALTGTEVSGYATLNAGRGGVRLNRDRVKNLSKKSGKDAYKNLVAHELDHATKQKAMGSVVTNKRISGWSLNEKKSERAGKAAQGQSKNFRRPNQPDNYSQAEDDGEQIEELGVSEQKFNKHVENGDTFGLQVDIIKAGTDNGKLSPEQIQSNIQQYGKGYQHAVQVALNGKEPKPEDAQMAADIAI